MVILSLLFNVRCRFQLSFSTLVYFHIWVPHPPCLPRPYKMQVISTAADTKHLLVSMHLPAIHFTFVNEGEIIQV